MHIKRPARVLFVLGMVLVLLGAAAGQQAIRRYEQAVLLSLIHISEPTRH